MPIWEGGKQSDYNYNNGYSIERVSLWEVSTHTRP